MSTRAPRSPHANPLRWLTAERLKARKHAKHAKHNPPACGCTPSSMANPQRLTRAEFDRRYWKVTLDTPQGAAGVPVATRREFYSDYRESGLSFAAYVKSTTTPVDQRYNPKDRTRSERAMLMRERLERLDAAAANMYKPGWEGRNKKAHAHRLKLAAVNQEMGQGMSETSAAWRAWRKERGAVNREMLDDTVTPALRAWRAERGMPQQNPATDDRVIRAFLDKASASSKKLTSSGQQLDGNWMGGSAIATWTMYGRIHFPDKGSKAALTVQKKIAKEAPRNWIDPDSQWILPKRANPTGKRDGTWARSELHHMVSHDYSAPYPAEIGKGQRVADGWVFHVTFRKAKWGKQHGFGPEFDRWYQVYAAGGASLINAATARALMPSKASPAKANPFRLEPVRHGGSVYGYGVLDETTGAHVQRAGKPFMTEYASKASTLAKRMTARERGERVPRVPVTPERAQEIIEADRSAGDRAEPMSPGERAYVNAVWNRMPGSASLMSALVAIANGRVPAKGRIS